MKPLTPSDDSPRPRRRSQTFSSTVAREKDVAVLFAKYLSFTGLGALFGPLLGSLTLRIRGRGEDCFLTALALNLVMNALVCFGYTETLAPEKRNERFVLAVQNPFGFLRLFRTVGAWKHALIYFFNMHCSGSTLSNHLLLYMQESCGFGPDLSNLSIMT